VRIARELFFVKEVFTIMAASRADGCPRASRDAAGASRESRDRVVSARSGTRLAQKTETRLHAVVPSSLRRSCSDDDGQEIGKQDQSYGKHHIVFRA
jgi:hypothetical protein